MWSSYLNRHLELLIRETRQAFEPSVSPSGYSVRDDITGTDSDCLSDLLSITTSVDFSLSQMAVDFRKLQTARHI
jgi:hypothetical protein